MIKNSNIVIAIDGYSSCGKSTVAKDLAKLLNIIFIDSGAMYRCVTLHALRNNIITDSGIDEEKLKRSLEDINITFKFDAQLKKNETFLNKQSVETEIRGLEVSNNVSAISAIAFVRRKLVDLQQEMGTTQSIVMDGRDIGTVVFPKADLKIFMTADPNIRAERRFKEYQLKGEDISIDQVLDNVKQRDYIDENRDESPLRRADDAIIIDNSKLTKDQQLQFIVDELKTRELI